MPNVNTARTRAAWMGIKTDALQLASSQYRIEMARNPLSDTSQLSLSFI
jgi:hypothetical protein